MVADIQAINAKSLDYRQEPYRHPSYDFVPVFNNQYGSPIVINSGQQPSVFNLPTDVFNLAESYLMYDVNINKSSTVGQYIWYPQDTFAEISHIQFYGSSNQLICDLNNVQNYIKIVGKVETSYDEFITNDAVNRLYPNNSLTNVVPALRAGPCTLLVPAVTPTPSSRNYVEPAYFQVSSTASDGTNAGNPASILGNVSYKVQLPLKAFKNTIFAVNKNFYFNQIMYIKIYFGSLNKLCFQSASNASPNAGAPAAYVPLASGLTNIANLQLMLARETNEGLRMQAINQIQSGSMTMVIPYAYNYLNSVQAGSSANVNLQLDIGSGRAILRMYHSVFNSVESSNTLYDCSNTALTTTTSEKVNQYWTNLNGKRVQTNTIDTTSDPINAYANTDYLNLKSRLSGSVMENMQVFKYNWFHMDDFAGYSNDYVRDGDISLLSGVALGPTPITWTFVGNNMAAASFNHYSWGIFTKVLSINATGPQVN